MAKIRGALEKEAAILSDIAIESKAYWDYSKEFIKACKDVLTINKQYIQENHVYVLEDQEELVGFFSFERDEVDSLDFFYILPEFIGKGFGRVMWNNVIQKAQEQGIKSFTIDSDPYAKGFYEKMGAKQIGQVPSTVFKDRSLPLMKITIG
ncbi:GNAT family N-acetyltransferase [Lentibacillus salicampi]|uniref:GNAT family N-acetyltransferase n=1 Tax=Lentibacillus salicampi TaxID=175306 RepID=A0A4Y9A6Q8_9BACI|nr:GNAT family N-acetyltransferase [Lentibacillus salicampi]TFJ91376.1 GNAT family N-acetyltransferase [Lentibacillus salicampi]